MNPVNFYLESLTPNTTSFLRIIFPGQNFFCKISSLTTSVKSWIARYILYGPHVQTTMNLKTVEGQTVRIPSWIYPLLLLLSLAGCSSYAIVSDYDSSIAFGSYKAYRWDTDAVSKTGEDFLAKNPLIYKHIKAAVDRELSAKGFVRNDAGPVDFTVSLHAGIQDRMTVGPPSVSFSYHQGYYRRGHGGVYSAFWLDPYGPYPRVTYYEVGTLIIDIIDMKTRELAWRGIGREILKNYDSAEEMHKDLDIAVSRILVKFPPLTR